MQLEQDVEPKPERLKQARETDSVFQLIGRQKLVAAWVSRAEAERLAAISKRKLMVLQNPGASSLGRQLLALNEQPQLAAQVVDDTFESKRTKTISSRAGSILLFMRWLMASTLQDKRVLPLNEETVYFYTSWLKATKAPATRSKRFLEAVGFMIGTIGADGAKQVLESARCQGSSLAQFKNKGPHVQRDVLTVEHVAALEEAIFKLPNVNDRVLAGLLAFLTHARARFGDVHVCDDEPFLDVDSSGRGFIELRVHETKVTNRPNRRRKLLPLVALAIGVTGKPWAAEWLKLRKEVGLSAKGGPLVPAISASGVFTKGRLRSSEGIIVLCETLQRMQIVLPEEHRLGTHSCKATLLSWMAKAEAPLAIRKMLGGHSSSVDETALLYSRDAMAEPMAHLERVMGYIRSGIFCPDSTRPLRRRLVQPCNQATSTTEVQEIRRVVLLESRLLKKLALAFVPRVAAETGRAGHVSCVWLRAASYALVLPRTYPA